MNNWKYKIMKSLHDNVKFGDDGNIYVHDWKVIEEIESLLAEQKKEILDLVQSEVDKKLDELPKEDIWNGVENGKYQVLKDISTIITNLKLK